MKFRKKPILVNAEQWFPDKRVLGVKTLTKYILGKRVKQAYISLFPKAVEVQPGDWIVTGEDGELLDVCKDYKFEEEYELTEA